MTPMLTALMEQQNKMAAQLQEVSCRNTFDFTMPYLSELTSRHCCLFSVCIYRLLFRLGMSFSVSFGNSLPQA